MWNQTSELIFYRRPVGKYRVKVNDENIGAIRETFLNLMDHLQTLLTFNQINLLLFLMKISENLRC